MAQLRDFNIAFFKDDVDTIVSMVTDDIFWEMKGSEPVVGKDAFTNSLKEMNGSDIEEVEIHHIITHGNLGSLDATMKLKDGKVYAYCDVYVFNKHGKDALIKELHSYMIELPS